MTLNIRENDPGQKWVFQELMRYLVARARREERPVDVSEVNLFRFSDYSFAVLPMVEAGEEQMLMAAALLSSKGRFGITIGGQELKLNVKDEKAAGDTQKGLLTLLLGLACKVPADNPPEDGIYFNPAGEHKGSFSAYYVTDERALVASNKGIIKKALSQKTGITSVPAYRDAMALLPAGWDAYGYAHNENGAFEKMLPEKRKGWQTLLVTLLSPARRMAMALDVVDKDHSNLVIALWAGGPGEVKELRGKLEPTLAVLAQELLDGRIQSELRFEELPNALRINAKLSDTSWFWRKAFRVKERKPKPRGTPGREKMELIDDESPDENPPERGAP
jgi:hypothetical protein